MLNLNRTLIGSLPVSPETLGWTRAPSLDQERNGQKAYAYLDDKGRPYLFPPGVTPRLRVPTLGHYGAKVRHARPQ